MANYTTTGSDTFPAGHIVNIHENQAGAWNVSNITATLVYSSTMFSPTIVSGNKLLINLNAGLVRSNTGGSTTDHTYIGFSGTGLSDTVGSGSGNRFPGLGYVWNYRSPVQDTYQSAFSHVITDVINSTSPTFGLWMGQGAGTFNCNVNNQYWIAYEMQT